MDRKMIERVARRTRGERMDRKMVERVARQAIDAAEHAAHPAQR